MFRLVLPILGIALIFWAYKAYKKNKGHLQAHKELDEVTDQLEVQAINEKIAEHKKKLKDK